MSAADELHPGRHPEAADHPAAQRGDDVERAPGQGGAETGQQSEGHRRSLVAGRTHRSTVAPRGPGEEAPDPPCTSGRSGALGRPSTRGDVAQLEEHRVRIAGVRGSSPLISTKHSLAASSARRGTAYAWLAPPLLAYAPSGGRAPVLGRRLRLDRPTPRSRLTNTTNHGPGTVRRHHSRTLPRSAGAWRADVAGARAADLRGFQTDELDGSVPAPGCGRVGRRRTAWWSPAGLGRSDARHGCCVPSGGRSVRAIRTRCVRCRGRS